MIFDFLSQRLVFAVTNAVSRPVIPDKIGPLPNLRVQELRSMIEILRMPIHRFDPLLISFSIHILNQFPSHAAVATVRVHEQVVEIDDIFDAPSKRMRVPSNECDDFSRLRHCDCAVDCVLSVEKPRQLGCGNFFSDCVHAMIEFVVGMPVLAPGLFVFCFDWADCYCHRGKGFLSCSA